MRLIGGIVLAALAACGPSSRNGGGNNGGGGDSGGGSNGGGGAPCSGLACSTSCMAADENHSSVGCEYFAVDMDGASGPPYDACYAVFVANVSMSPVHMNVDWNGQTIDLTKYAKLPQGTGQHVTYGNFDPAAGLAPGAVAILFLDYGSGTVQDFGNVPCPVPAALGVGVQVHGTGVGKAFHITTDTPVVAYQELPYGGGAAAATGASLLIPSSAWQSNYIAVSAWDSPATGIPINVGGPSHDIVAAVDNTVVTIRPHSNIAAGAGVPAGTANQPWTITLNRGQYVQLTQSDPLSGSPITSSAPVGVFGGHQIMDIDRCCGDHGEQMLTPVTALGSEYVAAPHATRKPGPDPRVFHIYGAVDGTQLTYEPANLGAATVNQGQMIEIRTSSPFVVKSQDSNHPFALFTYMTGAGTDDPQGSDYDPNFPGDFGDPDFVRIVPPPQYLGHYVFFTDPTYPFTTLTITRQKVMGAFADVTLDCLGTIPAATWQNVGTSGNYQIAYVKLVDHWNNQGNCNNGVHVMDSANAFGVWVWGWGSKDTNTGWVSYGYPAGEAVLP
ncbi:MAG: IgGFc-binding protein, partial [Deltaproteobacteria bacterium]|nr:IgGFc-binding protein [Deltaproteobacteria bacterium]